MELICCSALVTGAIALVVVGMQKSGYSDAMNELRRRERRDRDA